MTVSESTIRLLVVDDQEVVCQGVKALVNGTEIQVVAELPSGQAAVKFVMEAEVDVDVVLLDIRMPDGDGLTALGRIKLDKPALPVLLFSAFDNPASVAKAIALGASGFLLKSCTRDELLIAIRAAARGENVWSREKLRSVSGALRTPRLGNNLEISLSEREGEVLRQMTRGLTNKQIAQTMDISYETVKEHVQHVLRKIGLTDRTQAAVWAVRNQLV
jgi:DNA-binding NarL/FixJ family response regulator